MSCTSVSRWPPLHGDWHLLLSLVRPAAGSRCFSLGTNMAVNAQSNCRTAAAAVGGALCFETETQALMACSKEPLTPAGHCVFDEGQNIQHTFGGKIQVQDFHSYSQLHSWLKAMLPDISSPSLLDGWKNHRCDSRLIEQKRKAKNVLAGKVPFL